MKFKKIATFIILSLLTSLKANQSELNQKLLFAVENGDIELAEDSIRDGASINSRDSNGETPLMWAVSFNYIKVAELLIRKKACVSAKDLSGNTALIHASVARDSDINILNLLIKNGADINAINNDGSTALLMATLKGFGDKVKLLLDSGANIAIKDNNGKTAAEYALLYSKDIADILNIDNLNEEDLWQFIARTMKKKSIYKILPDAYHKKLVDAYIDVFGGSPNVLEDIFFEKAEISKVLKYSDRQTAYNFLRKFINRVYILNRRGIPISVAALIVQEY